MDTTQILQTVKWRLGISSDVRDKYLTAIIRGVIDDLTKIKGVRLDPDNMEHFMFIVDWAYYRYSNRDDSGDMPRHLRFRLNNIYVHDGNGDGDSGEDNGNGDGGNQGGGDEGLGKFKHCDIYPRSDNFQGGFSADGKTVIFNGGPIDYDCAAGQGTIVIPQKNIPYAPDTYFVLDLTPGSTDIITASTNQIGDNQYFAGRMYNSGGKQKVIIHGLDSAVWPE